METFDKIMLTILIGLLSMCAGAYFQEEINKKIAVSEGHAHWLVDDSGETTFEWNPPCKK